MMAIRRALRLVIACFLVIGVMTVAFAQEDGVEDQSRLPEFSGEFRTFFIYQNDSDFDDTDPLYSKYGQSVGYISTMIKPNIMWAPHEAIALFYELEIGDNIWSRNDANQGDATGEGRPIFRHKQFWGSVRFPNTSLVLTAGYRYVYDPTHLVLDRYLGSADLSIRWKGGGAALGVAQIPDVVYEGRDPNQIPFDPDMNGFDPNRNNYQNDDFVIYATADQFVAESLVLRPGLFFRWDRTIVNRPRWYFSPAINVSWSASNVVAVEFDVAGQAGKFEGGGIDNRDVDLLGGAAQIRVDIDWERVGVKVGALALSPDDGDPYNLIDNSFDYSGFSKSRTVILSQNWLQDTYDNLDERAAVQKAGLLLADAEVTSRIAGGLSAFVIAGYGLVFEDEHLNGDPNLGVEADGGIRVDMYDERVRLTLMGGALFPGKAAAALSNEIDTGATQTLWNTQGAFEIFF